MTDWKELWENHINKRTWYERIYYKVYGFIYRIPTNISHGIRVIKSYFIRGKRGWAPMDTWSLDWYLAKVIRDSVLHLKETTAGYPSTLESPEEWEEILDKIAWTFDIVIKIGNYEIYMFEKHDFDSEERYEEVKKNLEDSGHRVITDEEIQKYYEGWKLFEKHFFSLWS